MFQSLPFDCHFLTVIQMNDPIVSDYMFKRLVNIHYEVY